MTKILENFFQGVDKLGGPERGKYINPCKEEREILTECILTSTCFKERKDFAFCLRDGIEASCRDIRSAYYQCRKTVVPWTSIFEEASK